MQSSTDKAESSSGAGPTAEDSQSTAPENTKATGDSESADEAKSMQIPRDVIKRMRDTVFGFDTFFVTGVENYEANGVLFQGNLRGDPAVAYEKMQTRCQVCAFLRMRLTQSPANMGRMQPAAVHSKPSCSTSGQSHQTHSTDRSATCWACAAA